ncbi:hypothetical protein ECTOBSL9_0796 [Ectothiorhodospira sp. BSL-9]|nr:hypothetical protein ECTOBSL9_0796 [Ectothiorhodospira sp. BSL-9]
MPTITGTVDIPEANFQPTISQSRHQNAVRLAGDFLIGTANAQAGPGPYWIELIRVNPHRDDDVISGIDGQQLRSPISDDGTYTIEIPQDIEISTRLVLRVIQDGESEPVLRAIVTGDRVNVDPISEFITAALMDSQVQLDQISVDEVMNLRAAAESVSIDEADRGTTESWINALKASAGNIVNSEITELSLAPADYSSLGTHYKTYHIGKGLGFESEMPRVATQFEEGHGFSFRSDSNGEAELAESTFYVNVTDLSLNENQLNSYTTNEPPHIVTGLRFRQGGALSVAMPGETNYEQLDHGTFAAVHAPGTFRLQSIPAIPTDSSIEWDEPYAFVGLNRDSQRHYYQSGAQGPEDLDLESEADLQGWRESLALDLMVASGTRPELRESYGLVRIAHELGNNGCNGIRTEAMLAQNPDGEGGYSIGEVLSEGFIHAGCNDVSIDPPPETIRLIALQNGRGEMMLQVDGTDISMTGHGEPEGRLWVIPERDVAKSGDDYTFIEESLLIGMAVDPGFPDVAKTTWQFFGYESTYDTSSSGPIRISGLLGGQVGFCGEVDHVSRLAFYPNREAQVSRVGSGEINLEHADPSKVIYEDSAQVAYEQNGGITITIPGDNDSGRWEAKGFVSADGEMMLLVSREYATDNTLKGTGIMIAVKNEEREDPCSQ